MFFTKMVFFFCFKTTEYLENYLTEKLQMILRLNFLMPALIIITMTLLN